MQTRTTILLSAACTIAACAGSASADSISRFESFTPGADAIGADNWSGWDNVNAHAGVVSSALSYEGDNSILIQGYTDAVQTYSGIDSGVWSVQAKQYIASGQTGLQYFILMNTYTPGANNNAAMWSTQLRFDLASGVVADDFRGGSVPIAFDAWADIRVDIDLDADTVTHSYNNTIISTGAWTRGAASSSSLAAVNLFSADANSAYYDNITLFSASVPTSGSTAILAVAAAFLPMRRTRR